jgi:hypothetical protein
VAQAAAGRIGQGVVTTNLLLVTGVPTDVFAVMMIVKPVEAVAAPVLPEEVPVHRIVAPVVLPTVLLESGVPEEIVFQPVEVIVTIKSHSRAVMTADLLAEMTNLKAERVISVMKTVKPDQPVAAVQEAAAREKNVRRAVTVIAEKNALLRTGVAVIAGILIKMKILVAMSVQHAVVMINRLVIVQHVAAMISRSVIVQHVAAMTTRSAKNAEVVMNVR